MNQKNIFTGIGVVLVLQGIAFFAMSKDLAAQSFPGLAADGVTAVAHILTVAAMLSILIGLLAYATRNYPNAVWAMALGATLLTLNTLKHYFIDHLAVPLPALIIQVLISAACIYLYFMGNKSS